MTRTSKKSSSVKEPPRSLEPIRSEPITAGWSDEQLLGILADTIRSLRKQAADDIIEIGFRLTEAKALVGHGNWLPWLEREFGWIENTARNFMRVHEMAKSANGFGFTRQFTLPARCSGYAARSP